MRRELILLSLLFCGSLSYAFAPKLKQKYDTETAINQEFRNIYDNLESINGIVWDDLQLVLTAGKLGASSKPDYDYTNLGYLFPRNDATEIIYLVGQLTHGYKENSRIFPHLHWEQSAVQNVTWKIDYKWFNLGDAVPAGWTTLNVDSPTITYVSGDISQLSSTMNGIDGTGKKISSLILIKLYRDDNVYVGDALAFQLDIHYQKDSDGSRTIYAK